MVGVEEKATAKTTAADEEDVPDDFFDDLLNNDFLDGLDVVDAWDGDEKPTNTSEEKEVQKEPEVSDKKSSIKKKDDLKKGVEDKKEKKVDDNKKQSGFKDKPDRSKRSRSPLRKSPENLREKRSPLGARRDPNKTRRDIQRDKDRWSKDKAAKMISERLRVVETGLVPPGTEMEVDPSSIAEQHRKESPDFTNRQRSRSQRRSASGARFNKAARRSPSPKYRNRRASPPARRPPHYSAGTRQSPDKRRDFRRKTPSPSRPRRQDDRGEYARRSRSPRRDNKRSRTRSPRRSAHSRSGKDSPVRKRAKSFLEELNDKLERDEKLDKLKKLQDKINGGTTNQALNDILARFPPIGNAPMATAPVTYPLTHAQPPPVYDEQFFIGQQPVVPYAQMPLPPYHSPVIPIQMSNAGCPVPLNLPPKNNGLDEASIQKLFDDPNISLSEFLRITVRSRDSNSKSLDLNTRVKVLTRCQDAIKLMTEGSKPCGRFFYKNMPKASRFVEVTNQSPLKRSAPVKFQFTTKDSERELQLSPMERLLLKLGVKLPAPAAVVAVKETAPAAAGQPAAAVQRRQPVHKDNVLMKMTQTEPVKCDDCEVRNRKKTTDVGVQCEISSTREMSCQVGEDDFLSTARSALKNILKTQSLATLTPAQILAQVSPTKKDDVKREVKPIKRNSDESFRFERSSADRPKPLDSRSFASGSERHNSGYDRNYHDMQERNNSGFDMFQQQQQQQHQQQQQQQQLQQRPMTGNYHQQYQHEQLYNNNYNQNYASSYQNYTGQGGYNH